LVDFKKDTWIYVLIAAILALISIFTPMGTLKTGDSSVWWWIAITYNADLDPEWNGYGAATLWTLVLTSMAIALLLWYGIHNMKGMEFKWDWLVYALSGIALIILPILMLVYDYDLLDIGFAPIGILLSGIICIGAVVLEKFIGRE
jgi:hypothetical protein